jgi:hypothetical protein
MKSISDLLYTTSGLPYRWVELSDDEISRAIPFQDFSQELKEDRLKSKQLLNCNSDK